ncbi:hypothetical protein [Paenibacillus sp. GCM10012303]|uniref:hypothetical protein n=1 Tax=Paenibacillus sp. GCM10012303 TaxID=3317340 RepID=UPI00360B63DE
MNEGNKWQINGYIVLLLITVLAAAAVYMLFRYWKLRSSGDVRHRYRAAEPFGKGDYFHPGQAGGRK